MLKAEPLNPEAFATCFPLLQAYPFKPYAHYSRRVGEEVLQRLFLARVQESIKSGTHSALWVPGSDGAQGLAVWTRLEWDSQQLGFGAGRLDYLIASGDYQNQYATKEALLKAVLEAHHQQ